MVYVEEFLYRGRDPNHEKGKEATYHVVLASWSPGPDEKAQLLRSAPLTPEKATELGFPLDRILGDIASAAVLDRDAAIARAKKAETERDVAKTEWSEMAHKLRLSEDKEAGAQRVAADALKRADDLNKDYGVLLRQYDEAIAVKAPKGPSNPLLNALTFGLAGK